jgi:large subunit ribosomal protein L15
MQLHQLQSNLKRKKKKRVGRGGKRGTYSGRGQKGQRSRAGHRIRPAERDIIQKLPKLRGVKNKPIRPKPLVINVGELDKRFSETIIDKEFLLKRGVIKKLSQRIKILGGGEIRKSIELKGLEVSQKAREKIEKAGGRIQ